MARCEATWGSYDGVAGTAVATTSDEAIRLCDRLETEAEGRLIVGLTSEAGHYFGVGLGAGDSCCFYWESADPPYFQSCGEMADDQEIDYAVEGHHSEFSGTVRVPREQAFAALGEFITTGERPGAVAWQET